MSDRKILISIGRVSGSGGRRIGVAIAKRLGISCYDREIIEQAADRSGFSKDVIAHHDEKRTASFLYTIASSNAGSVHASHLDLPIDQKIFLAQYNTIRELAEEGNGGVFVGRCADYALEEHPDLIKVFITCDEEDCIGHIEETYGFSRAKAKDFVKKTNKRRAKYYNYYTGKTWGAAGNYDLTINRSRLGVEGTADFILRYIELRELEEDKKARNKEESGS